MAVRSLRLSILPNIIFVTKEYSVNSGRAQVLFDSENVLDQGQKIKVNVRFLLTSVSLHVRRIS